MSGLAEEVGGSGSAVIRVLIADDEPAVIAVLTRLIEAEPALELVGTAHDAEAAIVLARRLRPDVALVDVRMPHGGGPRATREITESAPGTAVVALSANSDRESVFQMIEAGALGYLVKGAWGHELVETITRAARRESELSPEITRHVVGKLSHELRVEQQGIERRRAIEARIDGVLRQGGLSLVYQPIVRLADSLVVGYEALARFTPPPDLPPDRWFADAEEVGRRLELELQALRRAFADLARLPDASVLAVNLSPGTILSTALGETLVGVDLGRVLLEVTEQAPVEEYGAFTAALESFRANGGRLAVDDAGAGFASLRHVLRLTPDVIKLDRALIEHVDSDRSSRALASAFVAFAREVDTIVLAEGIERRVQLDALLELGVTHGQGYLLGRPAPLG